MGKITQVSHNENGTVLLTDRFWQLVEKAEGYGVMVDDEGFVFIICENPNTGLIAYYPIEDVEDFVEEASNPPLDPDTTSNNVVMMKPKGNK